MPKHNAPNERIKRQYFQYLKEAQGYDPKSIDVVAQALTRFEETTRHRDFRAFHRQQAVAFKQRLSSELGRRSGKPLSCSTVNSILRHLRAFFIWLAWQPGFRSRLDFRDADYFNPSEKEVAMARATKIKQVPTLEQMTQLINKMPAGTVYEKRDRALVALAMLTGARANALASFRIKHIDLDRSVILQDGREVRTKFGKTIETTFFPVGEMPLQVVADWIDYLRHEMLWGDADPIFPATLMGLSEAGGFTPVGLSREPWSSTSPIRAIFKRASEAASLPYFNPHSLRDMLAHMGQKFCRTPEELKAWSQNLGHSEVLTTLTSYGNVSHERQSEIIQNLRSAKENENLIYNSEIKVLLSRLAEIGKSIV